MRFLKLDVVRCTQLEKQKAGDKHHQRAPLEINKQPSSC
jgi:hypothetical protein